LFRLLFASQPQRCGSAPHRVIRVPGTSTPLLAHLRSARSYSVSAKLPMNLKSLIGLITLGLLVSGLGRLGADSPAIGSDAALLVGTWKLISCDSLFDDGSVEPSLGVNPIGQLMYDAKGRMSVHLMSRNRPSFASPDLRGGTPEELKVAFATHQSYYGSYSVDSVAGTVSHHIEGGSFPNWSGGTQKRFFKLAGNRITLSTPPIAIGGRQARVVLVWERMN